MFKQIQIIYYLPVIFIPLICVSCNSNDGGMSLLKKEQIIAKGRELYLGHGCAVCHGKEGRGDGLSAEVLYPPPIDFHDASAYSQGSSVEAIERSIQYGTQQEHSEMPRYDHLSKEELKYIAEFIKSLQVPKESSHMEEKSL